MVICDTSTALSTSKQTPILYTAGAVSQASNLKLSYLTLRLRFFANYSRIEFYTTNSSVGKCAAGFGEKERYTVFSGGIAKAFLREKRIGVGL